jgi:hypothetical protein
MNTTASVKRKEAAAGNRYGASMLWMYRRSLATTTPTIWIQTDGLAMTKRFFHRL